MRRVASHSLHKLITLTKRGEFLAAARARHTGTRGFVIQARPRGDSETTIRVGFTCSKKVGNAVARNRAKRRLRALAQSVLPNKAKEGWDYVLIGRAEHTAKRPFEKMEADLHRALEKLHQ